MASISKNNEIKGYKISERISVALGEIFVWILGHGVKMYFLLSVTARKSV